VVVVMVVLGVANCASHAALMFQGWFAGSALWHSATTSADGMQSYRVIH